jgi:hypothetical protein
MARPTIRHRESAMKHIDLNTQSEEVKRFFLSLPVDRDGSVVELDGHVVARVVPLSRGGNGQQAQAGPWTEAKANRRCDLVDREIDGTLTSEEAVELEALQRQMRQERQRLAPVPLGELRRLHQELLTRAQQQSGQGGR